VGEAASCFIFRPTLSSRLFSLEPSPNKIRICTSCWREIVTRKRTVNGDVISAFVSAKG
jgi:hypothetical protein